MLTSKEGVLQLPAFQLKSNPLSNGCLRVSASSRERYRRTGISISM